MIKTYIIDLDGVIVDTAKYHYLAWKTLADQLGINFNEKDNEQLKGVSRVRSLELILEMGNIQLSKEDFKRHLTEKNEDYLSYIRKMDESKILPGVVEALDFLKAKGKNIVLGSASKNARAILENVKLMPFFDVIVDGNAVTKAKPDPEVFLLGAQKTNSAPKECVVFEDAVAGIKAANKAGMLSIGIGKKDVLTEADYVFSGFDKIPNEFLETLSHS